MFDYFAVAVQPEDVHPGVLQISGPGLVAVKDDKVAFCNDALEIDPLAGILGRHPLEVLDEGLLAVTNMRVVLGVGIAPVALDRLGGVRTD